MKINSLKNIFPFTMLNNKKCSENIPESYSDEEIIQDFCKAWKNLDADLILKHLDENFRYDSFWVFESLDKEHYEKYIIGKFETLKNNKTKIGVKVVPDHSLGGQMLALEQNNQTILYRIKIKDSKVIKGDLCAF